jgi:hypothetical protein
MTKEDSPLIELRRVAELPFTTSETDGGPRLQLHKRTLTVRYEAEVEGYDIDLPIAWTTITFQYTWGVRFTTYESLSHMDVSYRHICELPASPWVTEIVSNVLEEGIGKPSLHHFVVYFDDGGLVEVAAHSFSVSVEYGPRTDPI